MSNNKPVIIITGANGFLGSNLVDYFARKGYLVKALVRNPQKLQQENVEFHHYDLSEKINEQIFENADYLVHCAYIKTDNDKQALLNNIEGSKKLLEVSRRKNLKKNIFISSLSAKENALSEYGRQKFHIEKIFTGTDCLVIRPGLILGDGGLAKSIIQLIKKNKFIPLINGGIQPIQTADLDNLKTSIEFLIQQNRYGVYTIAEFPPVSYKDFCKYISKSLGLKRIYIYVPYWLVYMAVSLLNMIGVKLSISKDNLIGLKMTEAIKVDNEITTGTKHMNYQQSLDVLLANSRK